MADADQDKTEQPTHHRQEEARKQGQVAKSADLTGIAVLLTFSVVLMLVIAKLTQALSRAIRGTLAIASARPVWNTDLAGWLGQLYGQVVYALLPLAMALVVVAVVTNLAQTGPLLSVSALKPSFQRMHPMNAIRRLFSMRGVWELGKLIAKLAALFLLAWWALRSVPEFVATLAATPADGIGPQLRSLFWTTSIRVLLVLLAIALADLLFARREHGQKLRMSRREVRDDHKRRDGDPEVKARQRKQIRELLNKVRSLPRVAEADVVLTNPTHYAVAIRYRPQTMRAPVVLGKGRGFLAARVRAVAGRAGVPMMRRPALARALYRDCEIDAPVPEALFGMLAPVYRELYASGRARRPA
ncbi:MAG TPA: EscU/YscU/HrcU family type III secretion system export apparatus switch protein [Stenotrophomonas sp.]|nr:EscU/YscU/HrcU family type III secretion system export apparatus switch protein [Stenotrophomonas sp.]